MANVGKIFSACGTERKGLPDKVIKGARASGGAKMPGRPDEDIITLPFCDYPVVCC